MIEFVVRNAELIKTVAWVVMAIISVPPAYWMYEHYRWKRRERRNLHAAARLMARLAVFESWVRTGGRQSALCEDLELKMREDYAMVAKRVSPAYFKEFEAHEERADQELSELITTLKLNIGERNEEKV